MRRPTTPRSGPAHDYAVGGGAAGGAESLYAFATYVHSASPPHSPAVTQQTMRRPTTPRSGPAHDYAVGGGAAGGAESLYAFAIDVQSASPPHSPAVTQQ